MTKFNYIDLFAGCGGLSDGFEATQKYNVLAAVEWEKQPLDTLQKRLEDKYEINDAEERCINFDIQRLDELFNGWANDEKFGNHVGLDKIINKNKVDLIIGGPPCQAYSVAGRIRDENGMKNDYRNYLFESYIAVVNKYKPDIIVFENVPGMLSAKPNDEPIIDKIKAKFDECGYELLDDLNEAIVDVSDYGVPQVRKRIVIVGIRKSLIKKNRQEILYDFYNNILPKYKEEKKSVRESISDLPKMLPVGGKDNKDRVVYSYVGKEVDNHTARSHSVRDMKIFKKLAHDKENNLGEFDTVEKRKELYKKVTGRDSNIHKYHVLEWDKPSTTIVSHLHKDGLRHIHPDAEQGRTITIREAARLQSFADDFIFLGNQSDKYKMIGNAVPPKFAEKLGDALVDFHKKYFNN